MENTVTRPAYRSYPSRTILKLTTKWKVLYHCQAATLGPYHGNNCSRISTLCHISTCNHMTDVRLKIWDSARQKGALLTRYEIKKGNGGSDLRNI